MITKDEKSTIIQNFRRAEADTGSAEVQVALLTNRINQLTEHFNTHSHDHHSRIGLLKLVGKRRSLLGYLKKKDSSRYIKLIKDLGLRK